DVNLVADLFQSDWAVRKPVIVAGRGAHRAGARSELERLSGLTGALLSTTLLARSMFQGHPRDIGTCGSLSSPLAGEFISEADTVLAFGASLNDRTTMDATMFRNARLIQVDANPAAFGRFPPTPDLTVHADARGFATALADELERRGHEPVGFSGADVEER